MSFKTYKFCQNALITLGSAIFSMYYNLSISGSLPWWAGILISLATAIICLIPPIGIIHPITYGIIIIVALIRSIIFSSNLFWLILLILILHIVRNVAISVFAYKNPQLSLLYDEAIRYGHKLF